MKASLKFKEEQNPPILRFKVPLNILGFPFQSGFSACGDTKDLSLKLSTFFESGPSFKLVYKPNDSWNPFSLVVKTGIGPFGSPISAPLSMSAEFNLLSRGNPSFLLRFSPQFGDFSFKKTSTSVSALPPSHNIIKSSEKLNLAANSEPPLENGWLERVNNRGNEAVSNVFNGVFNGVEFAARTALPIRNRAVLKFNWGIRLSEELKSDVMESIGISNGNRDPTVIGGGISFGKIPFLVMNKISIEHVAQVEESKKRKDDDVAAEAEEACFGVKRELDVLHAENGSLRRAVEELRSEISAGKLNSGASGNSESGNKYAKGKSGGKESKASKFDGFPGKVIDGDGHEEVKKGVGTGK